MIGLSSNTESTLEVQQLGVGLLVQHQASLVHLLTTQLIKVPRHPRLSKSQLEDVASLPKHLVHIISYLI